MAVNPNNRHAGRHALFLGMTGSGKSVMMRQELRKRRSGRVIYWDTNREHSATYASSRGEWLALLQRLAAGERLGAIGYAPAVPTPAEWQWFSRSVWAVLDGKRETLVVAEEMAAVCKGSGKAQDAAGILINQGRKYGLVFWGTSQRPQEIEKTYYTNAAFVFVGQQSGAAMQRKMADEVGVTPADIASLKKLEFWKRSPGAQAVKVVAKPPK